MKQMFKCCVHFAVMKKLASNQCSFIMFWVHATLPNLRVNVSIAACKQLIKLGLGATSQQQLFICEQNYWLLKWLCFKHGSRKCDDDQIFCMRYHCLCCIDRAWRPGWWVNVCCIKDRHYRYPIDSHPYWTCNLSKATMLKDIFVGKIDSYVKLPFFYT